MPGSPAMKELAGATPMPEAQRALAMLPREKVIGLVLNRRTER